MPTTGHVVTVRRVVRAVGVLALVSVVVLVLVAVAPFALRERRTTGPVADTAALLPGQAGLATGALRRLGYSCADPVVSPSTVQRSCSRVRYLLTTQVQLVVVRDTGVVRLVQTSIDDEVSSATTHRRLLDAVGPAIGLSAADLAQVDAAATGATDATLTLGWGSAVIHVGDVSDGHETSSTLQAAGGPALALRSSGTTLRVPVDALAAAAEARGYTCTTPQVRTIRGCDRPAGGDDAYSEELSFQGTDAVTTEVYLSVRSVYHRQTRREWIRRMTDVLGWVDTGQTRQLRAWLGASADAPGGECYVDGLGISFLVRDDTYEKETFGVIRAECATSIEDISACEP